MTTPGKHYIPDIDPVGGLVLLSHYFVDSDLGWVRIKGGPEKRVFLKTRFLDKKIAMQLVVFNSRRESPVKSPFHLPRVCWQVSRSPGLTLLHWPGRCQTQRSLHDSTPNVKRGSSSDTGKCVNCISMLISQMVGAVTAEDQNGQENFVPEVHLLCSLFAFTFWRIF